MTKESIPEETGCEAGEEGGKGKEKKGQKTKAIARTIEETVATTEQDEPRGRRWIN